MTAAKIAKIGIGGRAEGMLGKVPAKVEAGAGNFSASTRVIRYGMRAFLTLLSLALGVMLLAGCSNAEDPGPTKAPTSNEKPADDKAAADAIHSDIGGPANPAPGTAPEKTALKSPEAAKTAEVPEKPADDANRPIPALKDASGKTVYPRGG